MNLALSGRGRLNNIIAAPPPITDTEHPKWAQKDAMVISWIIENIHSYIVNQLLEYGQRVMEGHRNNVQ